jgi:hypothetical protein
VRRDEREHAEKEEEEDAALAAEDAREAAPPRRRAATEATRRARARGRHEQGLALRHDDASGRAARGDEWEAREMRCFVRIRALLREIGAVHRRSTRD